MANQLLLLNPRKRKARKAVAKRRARPAASSRRVKRRKNPMPIGLLAGARKRVMRRGRRSNPIKGDTVSLLTNAAIGGAGAVGVDVIMGRVKPMLPASMQAGYSYQAAKAAATIALGVLAKKMIRGSTGNMVAKAFEGSLTVQAAGIIRSFLPSTVAMGAYVAPSARSVGMNGVRGISPAARASLGAYVSRGTIGGMGSYQPGAARVRDSVRR